MREDGSQDGIGVSGDEGDRHRKVRTADEKNEKRGKTRENMAKMEWEPGLDSIGHPSPINDGRVTRELHGLVKLSHAKKMQRDCTVPEPDCNQRGKSQPQNFAAADGRKRADAVWTPPRLVVRLFAMLT